jgi:hypothetical protein
MWKGKLPFQPLQSDDKAGRIFVTKEELEYVEKYYNAATKIAIDANNTRDALQKAIFGWEAVLRQAKENENFTRQAVWDAVNRLNWRFSNEGGSFLAYLTEARDKAARIDSWASSKRLHAMHILGKKTPDWYAPPAP